jgi:chromate transporter
VLEVFRVALLLGLTSFGGPIAHVGYFHREYVARRRWLLDREFADLVALCQLLPGPASSQLGMAIGLRRAGWGGALAAWLGFTLPSAVLMIAFAYLATDIDLAHAGWIHGLQLAAVAVVGAAVWSMWRALAPDMPRSAIVVIVAGVMLATHASWMQLTVILAGALAGRLMLRAQRAPEPRHEPRPSRVSRRVGAIALAMFSTLLIGLILAAHVTESTAVAIVAAFYRSGALVFGGGHVILPLLHDAIVDPSWLSDRTFLAGYGAAQALPGPLFTFAGFLGVSMTPEPNGVAGAIIALITIFLPAALLLVGVVPFWDVIAGSARFRSALAGTNAAVTGLLLAALYDPVWTSAVSTAADVALVAAALLALTLRTTPPWIVVAALACAGEALQYLA